VGDVFVSPAEEADLEPAQRTWRKLTIDDRIALEGGVMLRTGKGGTLRVTFANGARIRLQPSTLFGVKKV